MLVKLNRFGTFLAACIIIIFFASAANADLHGTGGSYQLDIATSPAVVPVSSLTINVLLRTSAGSPVSGADIKNLTQMPGMPMGEIDETATPLAGQPGVYTVPAKLVMAGSYNSTFHINGSEGRATIVIPISTGDNTGTLPVTVHINTPQPRVTSLHTNRQVLLTAAALMVVILLAVYAQVTARKSGSTNGPKVVRTIIGILILLGARDGGGRYVREMAL